MARDRVRININRDWRFIRGDLAGAGSAAFDDSNWQHVGLPHTFDLPYFRTPEFYVGVGWYRKRLSVPSPGAMGQGWVRAFVDFEGCFQVTDVYVNGHHVGNHAGGYTGFEIDITTYLRPGENVLAVRVSSEWNPRLAPRAGEHIFSGGLYRDVHLSLTAAVYIPWNGVGVTTPQVSQEAALVRVKTEVCNMSNQGQACRVRNSVVDADGYIVATMESSLAVDAGRTVEVEQTSESINRPRLWHPDHPHLYSVLTELFANDEPRDCTTSPLGFRWFEWTADRGFFLNGEHLYLRGANAHQDHSGWGIAITKAACARDVKLMKEAGFNFLRGAHYPHHPAFAEACDRLGMIFWSENCFWGKGGFGPEGYWNASAYPVNPQDFEPFEQHCKQTLSEMIRINRNHPSIMVWSMTNEAFFTFNLERARSLMADLVRLSRELDATRPAAIGGAQRGDVDKLGDIAGYNGDGARLFFDPGVPNMVSEYGAISKPHDAFEPFYHELQTEPFPWRAGQAIWCGFDYGTIAGKQGLKGIVDHSRLPKRSWHWYRKELLGIDQPQWPMPGTPAMLKLEADKDTIIGTDATDDVQIIVTVCDGAGLHISNSPQVALAIESGPGEFPTGRSITFDAATDIKIVQGQAAIALRSYHGGTTVIRASAPGLSDATITITTLGEPQFVPGATPIAAPRPYTPPTESEAAKRAMHNAVNVALNRPCRASSDSPNHPARLGNDGSTDSHWLAADTVGQWWQVDLEGFYQLAGVRVVFPQDANYRFAIELSLDGNAWTPGVDRPQSVRVDRVRNDVLPPGAIARFVRVNFTHVPPGVLPGLSELEVHGILSVR